MSDREMAVTLGVIYVGHYKRLKLFEAISLGAVKGQILLDDKRARMSVCSTGNEFKFNLAIMDARRLPDGEQSNTCR